MDNTGENNNEATQKLMDDKFELSVSPDLEEERVWRERIAPHLLEMGRNITDICQYGFTEMLNNVIDHSEAEHVVIGLKCTTDCIQIIIQDDGVGIFNKIQTQLGLEDGRHAILELSKGNLLRISHV